MLYHQLNQQNASIDSANQQFNERLNTSIDMLYQQLNQQDQQLRQEYTALDNRTQQLNTSTQLLLNGLEGPAGQYPFYPADSCATLPPSSPSGYYWVRVSDCSAVSVYCDMTLSCGGVTGGWTRVAELDMTNSSHQCPSGLRERNDSNIRTCVRNVTAAGCSAVEYTPVASDIQYSKVCGRVIGYQVGSTGAFGLSTNNINTAYVDGVSFTHGYPREHIWTLASAPDEVSTSPMSDCPCTNANTFEQATHPPEFVGDDYFCDTGSSNRFQNIFYDGDPLWDGAGCGILNSCCSFNNPPWFYKELSQPTANDIEMRVCRTEDNNDEDIAIKVIDLFVLL